MEKLIRTGKRDLLNLGNYVIVPQKDSEDLLFYRYRLGVDDSPEKIKRISKVLGIKLKNTGIGLGGEEFIGNITAKEALKLNLLTGSRTASIREFMDFRYLLELGVKNNKRIYDGRGYKLDSNAALGIYADIQGQQDPSRSEFLDCHFIRNEDKIIMNYSHRLTSRGNLLPEKSEPLEKCLMHDCDMDIKSLNRQGIPRKNSPSGEFLYHGPPSGRTYFTTNASRVILTCDFRYDGSGQDMGVRPVKVRK